MTIGVRRNIGAALLLLTSGLAAQAPSSTSMHGQSPFKQLIELGVREQTPIGLIVDGAKAPVCLGRASPDLKDLSTFDQVDRLVENTGYRAEMQDGVVIVKPDQLSSEAAKLLTLNVGRLGGMKTTMQGLGIILATRIRSTLNPDAGVAGDILSSNASEILNPSSISDVTVEGIANGVVNLGKKGMWFLGITTEESKQGSNKDVLKFSFRVLSFHDDLEALRRLSCQTVFAQQPTR